MPTTLGLYDISILPTQAANRCQLETSKPEKYRLQFVDTGIVLKDKVIVENTVTWRQLYYLQYDFIRRYGKRTNVFIIEAGRSCSTGEGEFRFQSPEAEKMFHLFRSTTEEILNRQNRSTGEEDGKRSPLADLTKSEIAASAAVPVATIFHEKATSVQASSTNPSSLLSHDATNKDETHIYAQVQKKRMAPNIPPRDPSIRKSNAAASATTKELMQHRKSSESPPPVSTAMQNDRREPIYTELMHDKSASTTVNSVRGSTTKANQSAKMHRCRSPAPLTDNFIRMDGCTQYASVVDFLPPQSAQNGNISSQSKSIINTKTYQQDPVGVDIDDNNNNDNSSKTYGRTYPFFIPEAASSGHGGNNTVTNNQNSNQKKKSKSLKNKNRSDKKGPNDENKQSSSWFNFFSSGVKKSPSS